MVLLKMAARNTRQHSITHNSFEVTKGRRVVKSFNKHMFLMRSSLINNDSLRSQVIVCLLALQTSDFELDMCAWQLDQAAEPAMWARLQAGHKIASCSFLKDWSNNTEGGKCKLMHSY